MNKTMKNKISLAINLSLSLFFFIILIYLIKKNNLEIFNKESRFFYNILLSLLLFVIHIIAIFVRSKNIDINLTIFTVSSYCSIIFVEVFATFYLSYFNNLSSAEEIRQELAKDQNIFYDSRAMLDVYDEKKKIVDDVVLSFTPAFFSNQKYRKNEIYPLGGISNSLTLHCNESGYYSTYPSDRYGFNNPNYVWDKEIDYLLLGDSFTHGACVNEGYDIASNLREFLPEKNFINLGMNSNDTLLMYSSWKEYGSKLNPKTVLWMHFENDIVELNTWGKNNELALKYFYDNLDQNLLSKQIEIDKKIKSILDIEYNKNKNIGNLNLKNNNTVISFVDILNKIRNLFFIRNIRTIIGINNVNNYNTLFMDVLIKAKKEINLRGGELVFVYLPSWERYRFKYLNKSQLYNKKKILNEVEKNYIDIIDLDELYFQNHTDPLSLFPFRTRGHYTVEGYKNISKIISDNLKNQKSKWVRPNEIFKT